VTFIPSAASVLPFLLVLFAAAAAVSFLLTPPIRRVAIRFKAVDRPGLRRVNTRPVPRGGGVAVAAAFVIVTLVALTLNALFRLVAVPFSVQPLDLIGLLVGGILAAAFGVVDDYFDLRARWQFLGQVGLAAIAIVCGITVDFIANPFGGRQLQFAGIVTNGVTALAARSPIETTMKAIATATPPPRGTGDVLTRRLPGRSTASKRTATRRTIGVRTKEMTAAAMRPMSRYGTVGPAAGMKLTPG